jgi:hypothetical protein
MLTATCVYRTTPELLIALAEHLGELTDSYVNGSQVWLRDTSSDVTLEWRLHPVAGYQKPADMETDDVFATTVLALADNEASDLPAPIESLWDGLEVFVAFGDDVSPALLADLATKTIDMVPTAVGLVDHDVVGAAWEQANGTISIIDALLGQLDAKNR